MFKDKKPDKKQAAKPGAANPAPAPAKTAPVAAPAVDPRQAVILTLDAEIKQIRAQVAALEKQGADEAAIERVRNRLRLRAIQRAKLG